MQQYNMENGDGGQVGLEPIITNRVNIPLHLPTFSPSRLIFSIWLRTAHNDLTYLELVWLKHNNT